MEVGKKLQGGVLHTTQRAASDVSLASAGGRQLAVLSLRHPPEKRGYVQGDFVWPRRASAWQVAGCSHPTEHCNHI